MSDTKFDFGHFFWSSSELMCLFGLDGYFKAVNPAFVRAMGYSEQELLSRPAVEFIHPEDRTGTANVVFGTKPGEAPGFFDNRYIGKDGSIHWFSWSGVFKDGLFYFSARDITARKRAEATLAEERRNLKFVLENTPVILSCIDTKGVLLYSSGKALGSLGLQEHHNVGRNVFELYRDVPEIVTALNRALRGEELWESFQIGENIYQSKFSPILDADYLVKGAIVCTLNVTEIQGAHDLLQEMRSELILRQAEIHFQETFQQAVVGICHLSTTGHFQKVNRPFCDSVGFSEQELLTQDIQALLREDSNFELKACEDTSQTREVSLVRKDGKIALNSVRLSSVLDDKGDIKYFIAVFQDITSRKELEDSLKKSEEQFRRIAEAIPQIVWTANKDGSWEYFNRRWHEYTNQTFQQSQGWGWRGAIHPEDRSRVVDHWTAAFLKLHPLEIEFRLRNASNDQYRWHLCRAVPMHDENSPTLKWFGTCTDIEDQKRTEQLVASEKAALEASKLKTEFLANMSHEIRTPLNGVLGVTDLLLETDLNSKQSEYTQMIKKSGKDLLVIINDILDLSKIEAGKMQIEDVSFNLADILDDLSKVQELAAAEKGLRLSVQVPSRDSLYFRGDPTRIRQVLFNLIQNAIKFTEDGFVQVQVWAEPLTNDRQKVLFMITDTGIGISGDHQKSLFSPFQQGDASTTRQYGGTGLGLSICRHLVQQMGGRIGVQSEKGKGSTFWFEIPFVTGVGKNASEATSRPMTAPLQGRVLIAEDNLINQKIVCYSVEKYGLQADVVENGQQALEYFKKQRPDLILMDCHMPVMDGFMATQEIRKAEDGSQPKIPIIALTADVVQGIREKCEAAGMTDYLSKPLQTRELERILHKYLHNLNTKASSSGIFEASSMDQFQNLSHPEGKDFIVMVTQQFLLTTPEKIKQLEEAWQKKNFEVLRREAHSLKSSSGALGALSLSQLCATIEEASIRQDRKALASAFNDLSEIFMKTVTEMTAFIELRQKRQAVA